MTETLSLGPVLDLIERLMPQSTTGYSALRELQQMDIPALRALAEQHAAQLREQAESEKQRGLRAYPETILRLEAAADFLCAPRREP